MTRLLLHLASTIGFLSAAASAAVVPTSPQNIVPGRYIVEFEDARDLARRSSTGNPADQLIEALSANGVAAQPLYTYDSPDLFEGAALAIPETPGSDPKDTLARLRRLPDVKNVWPVRTVNLLSNADDAPAALADEHQTLQQPSNLTPRNAAGFSNDSIVEVIPPSEKHRLEPFPRWNAHLLTGVSELHKRGITGKGVTVGIIDTGTFYYDEALGGGFGAGFKVAGGWNFVGDLYDPAFQGFNVTGNANPLDCNGHGSHVAGIIAGSNNTRFVGVAPDATLRSYKIFGCRGAATSDIIIKAILRAYEDGVDIASLSLGSNGDPFQNNPEGLVLDRLVDQGVFVAVAAGNSGSTGPFYGSALATGRHITTVGSTTTNQIVSYRARLVSSSLDSLEFTFVSTTGVQSNVTGTFDIKTFNDSACALAKNKSLPANSPGSSTALFLPQKTCRSYDWFYAVKDLGYSVVFNYLDKATDTLTYTSPGGSFSNPIGLRATAENAAGLWLNQQLALNHSVRLVIDETSLVPRLLLNPAEFFGTQLSSFTTWGPDFGGNLYPQVSAPGSNIYSTYRNYSYSILSGTSMSTPYISGVAALYLQSVGGRGTSRAYGREIRSRMIQTAYPLLSIMDTATQRTPAPLIQQGSGLVNATRLVDSKTFIMSDPVLNMGVVSEHVYRDNRVTIRNENNYAVIYNVSHIPSTTVYAKNFGGVIFSYFPPFIQQYASVKQDYSIFTIPPNSIRTITVSITLPNTVSNLLSPIYQGRIQISGHNGDVVALPYIGTFASNFSIWGSRPPVVLAQRNARSSVEVVKDTTIQVTDDGTSALYMTALIGAKAVDAFLVEEHFNVTNLTLPVFQISEQPGIVTDFSSFPATNLGRTPNGLVFPFKFPDGVSVNSGIYRVLYAGLPGIPGHDPIFTTTNEWEVYLSDPIYYYSKPTPFFTNGTNSSLPTNSTTAPSPPIVVTNIEVGSLNTNSSLALNPFDSFEVSISINSERPLVLGDSFNITLPHQFATFPKPFSVNNDEGTPTLRVTFVNNVLIGTVIQAWDRTFISGSIYFTTSLKYPETYGNELVPLTFLTSDGLAMVSAIDLAPVNADFPSSNAFTYSDHSIIQVYIPASFVNWTNLEISFGARFDFECTQIHVSQTTGVGAQAIYNLDYRTFEANCSPLTTTAALVKLTAPPTPGNSLRIDVPLKTSGDVRNSPVNVRIRGLVSGTEFDYYITNTLNNVNLNGLGLALVGRKD